MSKPGARQSSDYNAQEIRNITNPGYTLHRKSEYTFWKSVADFIHPISVCFQTAESETVELD